LHYARHALPGLKSTKNFGPPYFECSDAGTGYKHTGNEFMRPQTFMQMRMIHTPGRTATRHNYNGGTKVFYEGKCIPVLQK